MKTIGPMAIVLFVAGILLLMTAAGKPEYLDASGMLIEPCAYPVVGAGLTVLGAAPLALRYLVFVGDRDTRPPAWGRRSQRWGEREQIPASWR